MTKRATLVTVVLLACLPLILILNLLWRVGDLNERLEQAERNEKRSEERFAKEVEAAKQSYVMQASDMVLQALEKERPAGSAQDSANLCEQRLQGLLGRLDVLSKSLSQISAKQDLSSTAVDALAKQVAQVEVSAQKTRATVDELVKAGKTGEGQLRASIAALQGELSELKVSAATTGAAVESLAGLSSLQADVSQLKESIATVSTTVEGLVKTGKGSQGELQAAITTLQGEVSELKESAAKTGAAVESLAVLGSLQTEVSQLKESIATVSTTVEGLVKSGTERDGLLQTAIAGLQTELTQLKGSAAKTTATVESLVTATVAVPSLVAEVGKLKEEMAAERKELGAKITGLQEELERRLLAAAPPDSAAGKGNGEEQTEETSRPPYIETQVEGVDPARGVVVLGSGATAGVEVGQVFEIFRGGVSVGRVSIVKLWPEMAGAQIKELEPGAEIRENDIARLGKPPAKPAAGTGGGPSPEAKPELKLEVGDKKPPPPPPPPPPDGGGAGGSQGGAPPG